MKNTYVIAAIIVVALLAIYLIVRPNRSIAKEKELTTGQDTIKSRVHHTKENTYLSLRNIAFAVTPQQLHLTLPEDKTVVYGIVMDWGLGTGVATTVAYQPGDASLYLSSGGGVIGGGQHQNVNTAARQFVAMAQGYLDKTTKTDNTPLPTGDQVKFYLLTNKGIYTSQEDVKNFRDNSSPWLKLFEEGNKVLTELHKVSEKK